MVERGSAKQDEAEEGELQQGKDGDEVGSSKGQLAGNEFYNNLGTKEGEAAIYKVARQWAATGEHVGELTVIRNQAGDIVTEETSMKERWREYFDALLNKENARELLSEIPPIEGPIHNVKMEEVRKALAKVKLGKAAGCSGLSIDMIKALNGVGDEMIYSLLETIWKEERIPSEWEDSETVPIYRQKGDPLECGNYVESSC